MPRKPKPDSMITRFFIVAADEWRDGPYRTLSEAQYEVRKLIKWYKAPEWFYAIVEETYLDQREGKGRRLPGWMEASGEAKTRFFKATGARKAAA